MNIRQHHFWTILALLGLSACASDRQYPNQYAQFTGPSYQNQPYQNQHYQNDYYAPPQRRNSGLYQGTVVDTRSYANAGGADPLITAAGAALGGVIGSNFGKGRGRYVGAIVGATLVGLAAREASGHLHSRQSNEVMVRLDGSNRVVPVQGNGSAKVGQRVQVRLDDSYNPNYDYTPNYYPDDYNYPLY